MRWLQYHAGLTVRDRDRIRQDVLEGLGWRIYRVWSTDWFNDNQRETERLLRWLDEQLQAAVADYAERDHVSVPRSFSPPSSDGDAGAEAGDAAAVADEEPELLAEDWDLEKAETAANEPPHADADATVVANSVEPAQQASQPAKPDGRRHSLDGIEFYEPWAGYYEVWIGGRAVGEVERLKIGLPPSHHLSRPQYQATVHATNERFNYGDINDAVRAVAAAIRSNRASHG